MTQINHSFGETLEFSTTVRHGKITSQELVSSGPDCIVSFRMDKYLEPSDLRQIATDIAAAKSDGLTKATVLQAIKYIDAAKTDVNTMGIFQSTFSASYLAVAEYSANLDGLTLYDHRVTEVEVTPADVAEPDEDEEDYDEFDEDDEDEECGDEDELDPYEEDEWDDDSVNEYERY